MNLNGRKRGNDQSLVRKEIEGVHDMQNTAPCTALPSVLCLDTLSMLYHRLCREKVYRLWLQEKQASIWGGTEISAVSPFYPSPWSRARLTTNWIHALRLIPRRFAAVSTLSSTSGSNRIMMGIFFVGGFPSSSLVPDINASAACSVFGSLLAF